MATASDKIAALMGKRLAYAQRRLNTIVAEGETYWRYVFGTAPITHGTTLDDLARDPNTNPDELAIKDEADITVAPLDGMLRDVMSPYILSGDPIWINRQRPRADAIEIARLKLFEELAGIIWDESEGHEEFRSAIDDAFFYRVGWIETDFDDQKTLPRFQWADARDILVDCEVRSSKGRDQRWRARKLMLPLETAKWLAKEKWDAAGYEFDPVPYEQEALKAPMTAPGAGRVEDGALDDAPTDFVRLIRVFVRGKNPYTDTESMKSRRMNDPAGRDKIYTGQDHILILECPGGYTNLTTARLVAKVDWPFPCDPGEDPLTPVVLTRDNRSFYPYSRFQPSHSAAVATNRIIRSHNSDLALSSRRIIGYLAEHFANTKEFDEALYGVRQLVTAQLKSGGNVDQAIQAKNFGSPNPALEQGRALNQGLFDLISGLSAFSREPKSHEAALTTATANEDAQVRLGDVASLVGGRSGAICKVMRKCLMCARHNMTNDDVARWINMPTDVAERQVAREIFTKDGGRETVTELWPNNPSPQTIRDEVDIDLEPRSVRFSNPDKDKQNLFDLFKFQMELLRVIGDTARGGNPETARAIAEAGNAMIELIARNQNIANYQRCLIDFEKIVGPQPEPPQQANEAEMMAAQAQMMQAQQPENPAIPPQQKAAATRLVNQGASPESLPEGVR